MPKKTHKKFKKSDETEEDLGVSSAKTDEPTEAEEDESELENESDTEEESED